jgi:hypothetical protein
MRYKGTNIENAERQPDGCLNPTQAVWSTIARPYILGGVWYSASEKKLYAPLHCEYSSVYGGSDLVGTKLNRQIHLATSTDKGLTWNYEGPIITRDAPGNPRPEPEYSGSLWDGGEGDFLLYADEEHGYIYIYSGHNLWPKPGHKGPKFAGCHVSRCAISDKLAPGKWRKFYNGNWSEPALGGKASYVGGGYTIYSRSLKKYLSFQGLGTLAFCSDLAKQDWSPSFRIPDGRWVSDDIWACALTDTNKTDVSRFDKTLYVYTYWHAKPGAVYRIDFDHGETPNTLGFIVNGAASPLAYTMIPTRAYGEPLYDAGDPIESRRVRKVSYESPEMSYSDGWSSQTSTVKIRTIVTGAATISEADATVKAKLSGTTNSHVAFVFKGSGIYWRAATGPDCGKADVYLDGVFQQTVDLYGDFTPYQFGFIKTGLKEGVAHTIKIVVKGAKNPRSTGTVVRHLAFEYSAESYQASDGFCSVMGKNQWQYQAWDGAAFGNLAFNTEKNLWTTNKGSVVVGPNYQTPDEASDAVRKWVAPHGGTVRIEGVVALNDAGGDGVKVQILHNTAAVWGPSLVTQGKPASHDLSLDVAEGDAVIFSVNKHGTSVNDSATWDPVVTFVRK